MDPFLQANAELTLILDSAKQKRKLVSQHKKRIREHMAQQGLAEDRVGDCEVALQREDRCRFTKKGLVAWLENLPGEEPDDILSVLDDYENDMTESREVFKCKRRKTQAAS